MKTKNFFLLIALAAIAVIFTACPQAPVPEPEEPGIEEPGTEEPGTEEPGTETDYRDKWVGNYECEEAYNFWMSPPTGSPDFDTTLYFQTVLEVTNKGDSTLSVFDARRNKYYEVEKVDTFGYFFKHGNNSDGRLNGNFNGDSISMFVDHPSGHSLGSASCYKGKKISK